MPVHPPAQSTGLSRHGLGEDAVALPGRPDRNPAWAAGRGAARCPVRSRCRERTWTGGHRAAPGRGKERTVTEPEEDASYSYPTRSRRLAAAASWEGAKSFSCCPPHELSNKGLGECNWPVSTPCAAAFITANNPAETGRVLGALVHQGFGRIGQARFHFHQAGNGAKEDELAWE